MTVLRSALLLLFVCYCQARAEDCKDICKNPWNFEVIPGNVKCFASDIHASAVIKENVIFFGNLVTGDTLLEVPIETPDTAVIITLGIDSSYLNTHHSKVLLGVTDQLDGNWFQIVDAAQYCGTPPCQPIGPVADNQLLVSQATQVPPIFKFSVHPKQKFGYCQTAQEGGYINSGIFQQHISRGFRLFFKVIAWETEEFSIRFIHIQSL